ncbi:ADP-ribosyltransferase [Vibrio sp. CyArs1]|uniref:ADP-ribosyltransferase n=1 Tax=Vibrio sp. CyArs1 TaxID=2682577 RepID=UPI001F067738|nr:ADP-ribosyltransferase [Vibrio sp. CyArs1]
MLGNFKKIIVFCLIFCSSYAMSESAYETVRFSGGGYVEIKNNRSLPIINKGCYVESGIVKVKDRNTSQEYGYYSYDNLTSSSEIKRLKKTLKKSIRYFSSHSKVEYNSSLTISESKKGFLKDYREASENSLYHLKGIERMVNDGSISSTFDKIIFVTSRKKNASSDQPFSMFVFAYFKPQHINIGLELSDVLREPYTLTMIASLYHKDAIKWYLNGKNKIEDNLCSEVGAIERVFTSNPTYNILIKYSGREAHSILKELSPLDSVPLDYQLGNDSEFINNHQTGTLVSLGYLREAKLLDDTYGVFRDDWYQRGMGKNIVEYYPTIFDDILKREQRFSQEVINVSENFSLEDQDIVEDYTVDAIDYNTPLPGGGYSKDVESLDQALSKIASGLTVTYSGTREKNSSYTNGIIREGSYITNEAFMSTSKSIKTAKEFAKPKPNDSRKPIIFVIKGQSGKQIASLSYELEAEVLYPRRTTFYVHGIEDVDSVYFRGFVVFIEEIDELPHDSVVREFRSGNIMTR